MGKLENLLDYEVAKAPHRTLVRIPTDVPTAS